MSKPPNLPYRKRVRKYPNGKTITFWELEVAESLSESGKREKPTFKTKEKLLSYRKKLQDKHKSLGQSGKIVTGKAATTLDEIEKEAKDLVNYDLEDLLKETLNSVRIKTASISLKDYKDDGLQAVLDRGNSTGHYKSTKTTTEHFIDFIGEETLLCDIQPKTIKDFIRSVDSWKTQSTRLTKKSELQSFFAEYYEEDPTDNPCFRVTYKTDPDKIILDVESIDDLAWFLYNDVPVYKKDGSIDGIRICLLLQIFTSIGSKEVRRGRFKDIELNDFGGAVITIDGQKTKDRERENIISVNHFNLFKDYLPLIEAESEMFFFPEKPIDTKEDDDEVCSLYSDTRRRLITGKGLIIEKKMPHWPNSLLRRTNASYLRKNGKSLSDLREHLGHSFTSTTAVKHYINNKVSKADAKRYAEIGSAKWLEEKQQQKPSKVI